MPMSASKRFKYGRNIREGKGLGADKEYFTIENDSGSWTVPSREQFNDRKIRKKVEGNKGSGNEL